MDAGARAVPACHDLLVGLAGRLPDELLWRLRDWLAAEAATGSGAPETVSLLLPRELMRNRIGLTDHERDLLSEAAGGWGPARRLLDAVLPVHVPAEPPFTFAADPEPLDAAALSVLAVVRDHPGCVELSTVLRSGGGGEQRVVLVRGGDSPWRLAATLQRVLRAHGDHTPCVEVLTGGIDSPYHRAAASAAVPGVVERPRAGRGGVVTAPVAHHELLLTLAGRVDDDLLAWARELVAVGEEGRGVELLTAALVADRVALPEPVRTALVTAARAARSVLDADAALPAAVAEAATAHAFAASTDGTATIAVTVRELLEPVACRAWVAARRTPAGSASGPLPHPVVLVELAGADANTAADVLAYQLGTALNRAGVPASVEVFARGADLPAYHASALDAAELLVPVPADENLADADADADAAVAPAAPVAGEQARTAEPEPGDEAEPVAVEVPEAEPEPVAMQLDAPPNPPADTSAADAPASGAAAEAPEPELAETAMSAWWSPFGPAAEASEPTPDPGVAPGPASPLPVAVPVPVPVGMVAEPVAVARPAGDPLNDPPGNLLSDPLNDPLSGPLRRPLLDTLLDPTVDDIEPTAVEPALAEQAVVEPAVVEDLFASRTAGTGGFDPVPRAPRAGATRAPRPAASGDRAVAAADEAPTPPPGANGTPPPAAGSNGTPPPAGPRRNGGRRRLEDSPRLAAAPEVAAPQRQPDPPTQALPEQPPPSSPRPSPVPQPGRRHRLGSAPQPAEPATPLQGQPVVDPRLGLRPESLERLSPTDRALLARLQSELGMRPTPSARPAPRPRPLRADPPDIAG
ncbi:MAG: hypothetical protein ACT4RN_23880 [Pseudonocardia sp.]